MKIQFISTHPFPVGKAPTNRLLYYARGLQKNGNIVNISLIEPTEYGQIYNTKKQGIHENVPYKYYCGTSILSRKYYKNRTIGRQFIKLKRKLLRTYGIFNVFFSILFSRNKPDIIFLYLKDNLIQYTIFILLSRLTKSKIVADKSEVPYVYKERTQSFNEYLKKYIKKVFGKLDALIVISWYLKHYFSNYIPHQSIFLVPVLIDLNEFDTPGNQSTKTNYIAYCGGLTEDKDGVITLIKTFSSIKNKYPELKLYIIGDSNNSIDKEKVNDTIKKYEINNNVILTGFVTREQMIENLKQAKLLALFKPNNLQAKSCFPTKIGEYLATKNPVITTSIGEIPKYLTHKESAFLAEAGNEEDIINKLEQALKSNELSKIGENGYKIAADNFDYNLQTKQLNEFLADLINR